MSPPAPEISDEVEFCRVHVPALWVLARLCVGEGLAAEQTVVAAVAAAAHHPSIIWADPPLLWAILSQQIEPDTASSGQTLCPQILTRDQSEALALAVGGRTTSEIAALTRRTVRQVRSNLRGAFQALQRTREDVTAGYPWPGFDIGPS